MECSSTDRLRLLADSYLDHVLIALEAGDVSAKLRDFLDPWWVFERGGIFVHRRDDGGFTAHTFNNPCGWAHRERLRAFDWVSEGAARILDRGYEARIVNRKQHPVELRLMADHAVPLAVIKAELWRKPQSWSRESLRSFLRQNLRRGVIAFTEDQGLNKRKLRDRMPEDWQMGGDPYARYYAVGIKPAAER